ncbi:MAG TPA: hypothetical protein PK698_02095 [Bacilli bacterium]|jgi:hypothetical protein|nr:hypothetical protein [Bacilli bacterium]
MEDTTKLLDDFLAGPTVVKKTSLDGKEEEVCDLETGECYIIRTRDGIVERINKKFITEDGRQLLMD